MVSGVNAFFSCELLCAALVNASPAQGNTPATATARNKYRFIVEPPSFHLELREIMPSAEDYSNDVFVQIAYLFYIVANY
jgi:hypothetical protein